MGYWVHNVWVKLAKIREGVWIKRGSDSLNSGLSCGLNKVGYLRGCMGLILSERDLYLHKNNSFMIYRERFYDF